MLKYIRRFVVCIALLAVLGVFTTTAAVRADDPPNCRLQHLLAGRSGP